MKLTAELIEKQTRPRLGQQVILRDDLPGFGVRLTAGSVSYICEARVNGTPRRITICRYPDLTPEQARKEARKLLGKMASGKNPGRPRVGIPTLGEVFDRFLTTRQLVSVRYVEILRTFLPFFTFKSPLPVMAYLSKPLAASVL